MMRGLLFSLLCQQALKRQGRPSGLIGQYKPYLNSNDSPTRDILKDYSGQCHDIQLYNFGYALHSGYGLYKENYNNWQLYQSQAKFTHTDSKFNITENVKTDQFAMLVKGCKAHKIKVTGLTDGQNLKVAEFWSSIDPSKIYLIVEKDGIYEVPEVNSRIGYNLSLVQESCNITIEQIPDYPGALVSDGVDDYGLCENFPILTKEKGYTVILLREILQEQDESNHVLVSNSIGDQQSLSGAFVIERINSDGTYQLLNFGSSTNTGIVINKSKSISWQTSKQYNGIPINIGNVEASSNLNLFSVIKTTFITKAALYALEIYDHDLTDEEIESVKETMYNEYLTATNALQNHIIADYECYEKTNEDEDRAVLKDLSGNGHDIKLYNFGFAEGSGYGKYPLNFSIMNYDPNEGRVYERTYNKIIVTNVGTKPNSSVAYAGIKNDFKLKFKVSGLTEGRSFKLERSVGGNLFFDKDGEYEADIAIETIGFKLQGYQENESCNVTIELIPEYQGALVSDGVDDYGLCKNFPILNKEDGFTILAIRKLLTPFNDKNYRWFGAINGNANYLEYYGSDYGGVVNVKSFGKTNTIKKFINDDITIFTSLSYNNNMISKGNVNGTLNSLTLFCNQDNKFCIQSAFYRMVVLDKDCTTEEIKFLAKQMVAKHKEKTGETIELNF